MSLLRGGEAAQICAKCGGALLPRPAAPQPVLLTTLFGASFVAMLIITHYKKLSNSVMWPWSGLQFVLGMLVIRGRIRAKKTVFHCARCDSHLR